MQTDASGALDSSRTIATPPPTFDESGDPVASPYALLEDDEGMQVRVVPTAPTPRSTPGARKRRPPPPRRRSMEDQTRLVIRVMVVVVLLAMTGATAMLVKMQRDLDARIELMQAGDR